MWDLAKVWFAAGTQSIGGGVSTLFVIRRLVLERHRWVSTREFAEDYAFSQLSPGIHLVALAGLLGRRIAGLRGAAVSVTAMMLPAGLITAAMTALYATIADHPLATAAVTGMAPATGGMAAALAVAMARDARRRGRRGLVDAVVVAVAFAILSYSGVSSVLVIVTFAVAGSFVLRGGAPTSSEGGAR